MKKVLLLLSVMGFAGCSSYTLKNNWEKNVKADGTVVEPGECVALSDAFLFGVFPITVTDESDGNLPNASKDESYEAGNYVVTADGAVKSSGETCEVGPGTLPEKQEKPTEPTEPTTSSELSEEQVLERLKRVDALYEEADPSDLSPDALDELENTRAQLETQLSPEALKAYREQQEAQPTEQGQGAEEGAQQQDENANQGG